MEKLKKNRFLIGRLIVILLVLTAVISCGFENTVKKGTIRLDESITLEQAFENYPYFKRVEWDSFEDDHGRKLVEVTGEIDMNKMFPDMLEGELFEEELLDMLIYLAIYWEMSGIDDVISQGDIKPIQDKIKTSYQMRNNMIGSYINEYDSDPSRHNDILIDYYYLYLFDNDEDYIVSLGEKYFIKRYNSMEGRYRTFYEKLDGTDSPYIDENVANAMAKYNEYKQDSDTFLYNDLITSGVYADRLYDEDNFNKYADDDLIRYMRVSEEYFYSETDNIESLLPILKLFADGKPDEGLALYDKMAGYLTTDLKKNKSSYTCQFAITEDGFEYYAGGWSITIAIKGFAEPITFDFPESADDVPYIIAVYGNKSFIE